MLSQISCEVFELALYFSSADVKLIAVWVQRLIVFEQMLAAGKNKTKYR